MPIGRWKGQYPNCRWSGLKSWGLSTESCVLPEKRGSCSKLNKRHLDFYLSSSFLGPFTCYHFVLLYPSILETEWDLPRASLYRASFKSTVLQESPCSLYQGLTGDLFLPTSLPGTRRGWRVGEGARGYACFKIRVASEPRVSFITDYNSATLIRFLGCLNDTMSWHLAHGKLSVLAIISITSKITFKTLLIHSVHVKSTRI